MTYIRLADGTELPIEDGARLDRIVHKADSIAGAQAAVMAVTEQNLQRVCFFRDKDEPHGIYADLHLRRPAEVLDDLRVIISLTEHAVDVDATEESATEED